MKCDYIDWLSVNFDYLLVSIMVVHYKKRVIQRITLSGLKDTVITQSRRIRCTINLSQLRTRYMGVYLRCSNISVTKHFLNMTQISIII